MSGYQSPVKAAKKRSDERKRKHKQDLTAKRQETKSKKAEPSKPKQKTIKQKQIPHSRKKATKTYRRRPSWQAVSRRDAQKEASGNRAARHKFTRTQRKGP